MVMLVMLVMLEIRILELAEHIFVILTTAMLAVWRADVVKIRHIERSDAMPGLAITGGVGSPGGPVHALFYNSNRGKRRLGSEPQNPTAEVVAQ